MASKSKKKKRTCGDILRFYLTAFFILLASVSSFTFIFLVPFVIDPGFATLFAEFDPETLTCVTVESTSLFGLSNCSSVSSCREGCTRDVFRCTRINVNYFNDTDGILSGKNYTDLDELQNITWQYKYAKIFPNIKGCGYPPTVNCTIFNLKYQEPGTIFPCFYSRLQPNVTITQLNIEETKENLIYAIVIPWSCFIASVLYLLITYAGMKKPETFYSEDSQDLSSKASKEASNYSLRSISKSINQSVTKLRKDNDDKGNQKKVMSEDWDPYKMPVSFPKTLTKKGVLLTNSIHRRNSTLPPLVKTSAIIRANSIP